MKTAILIDHSEAGQALIGSFDQIDTRWIAAGAEDVESLPSADLVVFMQLPLAIPAHWQMPVLINDTLGAFQLHAGDDRPIARFCGWPTMAERHIWEIATYNNVSTEWTQACEKALNRKLMIVPNQPGFIAARIVAAIINEACYGLGHNICSADDMDTAMRLGTNYPRGPIAWMHEIGEQNIAALLSTLALHEKRYMPHPLLKLE